MRILKRNKFSKAERIYSKYCANKSYSNLHFKELMEEITKKDVKREYRSYLHPDFIDFPQAPDPVPWIVVYNFKDKSKLIINWTREGFIQSVSVSGFRFKIIKRFEPPGTYPVNSTSCIPSDEGIEHELHHFRISEDARRRKN